MNTNASKILARPDEDGAWATLDTELRCGCCGDTVGEVTVRHDGETFILQCACNEILFIGSLDELRAAPAPANPSKWARQDTIAPPFLRWLKTEAA